MRTDDAYRQRGKLIAALILIGAVLCMAGIIATATGNVRIGVLLTLAALPFGFGVLAAGVIPIR